jgi:hypothetical protein
MPPGPGPSPGAVAGLRWRAAASVKAATRGARIPLGSRAPGRPPGPRFSNHSSGGAACPVRRMSGTEVPAIPDQYPYCQQDRHSNQPSGHRCRSWRPARERRRETTCQSRLAIAPQTPASAERSRSLRRLASGRGRGARLHDQALRCRNPVDGRRLPPGLGTVRRTRWGRSAHGVGVLDMANRA